MVLLAADVIGNPAPKHAAGAVGGGFSESAIVNVAAPIPMLFATGPNCAVVINPPMPIISMAT